MSQPEKWTLIHRKDAGGLRQTCDLDKIKNPHYNVNNHLLKSLLYAWFFLLHFLKVRHTCSSYHPRGTRVILRYKRPPWLFQLFFKWVFFFSPDILEVLLKLTGFLGFGEGRKETTETSPWISCLFWHVGVVCFSGNDCANSALGVYRTQCSHV